MANELDEDLTVITQANPYQLARDIAEQGIEYAIALIRQIDVDFCDTMFTIALFDLCEQLRDEMRVESGN